MFRLLTTQSVNRLFKRHITKNLLAVTNWYNHNQKFPYKGSSFDCDFAVTVKHA